MKAQASALLLIAVLLISGCVSPQAPVTLFLYPDPGDKKIYHVRYLYATISDSREREVWHSCHGTEG